MLSPPGVDVDRFDWDEPPTSGPPRILYAGSIDPGRGVRVLSARWRRSCARSMRGSCSPAR